MKKLLSLIVILSLTVIFTGFQFVNEEEISEEKVFNIEELYDYQKEYKAIEIEPCATSSIKTYMDYRAITARNSAQYWFIHDQMTIDEQTGFLYDKDGFIGVALGSFYGNIGERYYFTLDSGIVLPLVKCESKADRDTDGTGCYHPADGSMIEFVIDKDCALNYFGRISNGYILNGNYNNYSLFNGDVAKVEKVLDEKNDKYVTYKKGTSIPVNKNDIFYYGSGY